MPSFLVDDKKLQKEVKDLVVDLQQKLIENREHRTDTENPQTLYLSFKETMVWTIRERAKRIVPNVKKTRGCINKELNGILKQMNDQTISLNDKTNLNVDLHEKLQELTNFEHKVLADARMHSKFRYLVEGEQLTSKFWTSLVRANKPQEVIDCIKRPIERPEQEQTYATRSKDMAEVGAEYHEQLQKDDLNEETEARRVQAIDEVLSHIPESQKLTSDAKIKLSEFLSRERIDQAIRKLPNGKATGLDGIPTEWWKKLRELSVIEAKAAEDCETEPKLDIVGTLLEV
jgi:hypothetical protein